MASITVKNIPSELLEQLRSLAKQERRSLTQQAITLIEDGLRRRQPSIARPVDPASQVAAWRRLAGRWRSDQTKEQEVADIYEARTGGRAVEL